MKLFVRNIIALLCFLMLTITVNADLPTISSGDLFMHVSADSGVYTEEGGSQASDGDTVGYWEDRSGYGNSAYNTVPEESPVFLEDVVNSKPVLRFRGAEYIDFAFMNQLQQPYTIFFVALTRDDGNEYFFDGIDGSNRSAFTVGAGGNTNWFMYAGNSMFTTASERFVWMDHTLVFDSNSSKHYISSELQGEGDAGTGSLGWGMRLGCRVGFSHYGNFDVAEIIIYEGVLNTTDINSVSDYLVDKYDITGERAEPDNQGEGTLIAKFDGTDITTDGTNVLSWEDQIDDTNYPLDLTAVEVDMNDAPNYPQLAQYDFGGDAGVKNVVNFSLPESGSEAPYLQSDALTSPVDIPTTFFVVARHKSHPLSSYLFDGVSSDSRRALAADGIPATYKLWPGGYDSDYTVDLGAWQVFTAVFNEQYSQIFVDGFTEDTYGYGGFTSFEGLTVGARYSGSNIMDGMIAEILVYEGALDPNTREAVESSLMDKYNIGPFCGGMTPENCTIAN